MVLETGKWILLCNLQEIQKAISTSSFCLENASCSSGVTYNTLHQSMAGKITCFVKFLVCTDSQYSLLQHRESEFKINSVFR